MYNIFYCYPDEVFIFAFGNACIPFYGYKEINYQYGDLGYYCWIRQPLKGRGHTVGFVMRTLTRYGQGVLIMIFNFVLYYKLYKRFAEMNDTKQADDGTTASQRAKSTIRKFIFYPRECLVLSALELKTRATIG